MMFDQFGISLRMFLIVELTKLGGQNFKSGKILALKMKGQLEPLLLKHKEQLILKMINSEIVFRNLFDQKRSIFIDLRSKT